MCLALLADHEGVAALAGRGRGVEHRGGHRVGAEGQPTGRLEVPVLVRSQHAMPTSGAASPSRDDPPQVDVVVRLPTGRQGDLAVDDRLGPDDVEEPGSGGRDVGAHIDAHVTNLGDGPWRLA